MTDDRRLRDKLAKLVAEDDVPGPRRLVAASGAELTLAILEEIDETILARTLRFAADDGAVLRLEVTNRRLLGLVGLPQDAVPPEAREALLAPLPPDDDDALAAVAAAIRDFAGDGGALTVSAEPLGRSVGSGVLGRSAVAAAATIGLELYDRPAAPVLPDPADGFGAGIARLAGAVATASAGEPSAATGPDAAAVSRLSRLDGETIARFAAELGPDGDRTGRSLLLIGGEAALFFGQQTGGRATVALLPPDNAGAVAALWRATDRA